MVLQAVIRPRNHCWQKEVLTTPHPLCVKLASVSDSQGLQPVLLLPVIVLGNACGAFPYCPQAYILLKLAFCSVQFSIFTDSVA